ncbi:hypothetical protein MMC11_004543 [Xylographa trunciseda]|nr:hypothetical protein [Xylographa trunciseda]
MSTSNLARIRDNQRRSRARRKEHLQNTEKRLRELEREGVEVSTDIQKAARRVVEENIRLRSLLRLRGVTDVEIDEHLRASVNGIQEIASATHLPIFSQPTTPESLINSPMDANIPVLLRQHDDLSRKAGAMSPAPHIAEERPTIRSVQPDNRPTDYRFNFQDEEITEYSRDIVPSPNPTEALLPNGYLPKSIATSATPSKVDNTTSCLLAANILAGMCCVKTAEEVSVELGCFPGTDCEVDNVKLFQIMDR